MKLKTAPPNLSQLAKLLFGIFLLAIAMGAEEPSQPFASENEGEMRVDTSCMLVPPFPYTLEDAFPGLSLGDEDPIQVIAPQKGDDLVIIACRAGKIYAYRNDGNRKKARLIVDLADRVELESNEQGLFSVAADPRFSENGRIFVSYSAPLKYTRGAFFFDLLCVAVLALAVLVVAAVGVPNILVKPAVVASGILVAVAMAAIFVPRNQWSLAGKAATAGVIFALVMLFWWVMSLLTRRWTVLASGNRGAGIIAGLLVGSLIITGMTVVAIEFSVKWRESAVSSTLARIPWISLERLAKNLPFDASEGRWIATSRYSRLIVSHFCLCDGQGEIAETPSETVTLSIVHPSTSHYAGHLEFGPDRNLYISVGDGGFGGTPDRSTAQDRRSFQGSILRINVDAAADGKPYSIPRDNPFVGSSYSCLSEIWAYGFRNPWRFAFDSNSGQMWVGDVGYRSQEEINLVVGGGNYGWPAREGLHPSRIFRPTSPPDSRTSEDTYINPIATYSHRDGFAVVAGRVYEGNRFPELKGAFLYADYLNGSVWAVVHDGETLVEQKQIASCQGPILSFGHDQHAEILICSRLGKIYRLRRNAEYAPDRKMPEKLSETGLFRSVKTCDPRPGVIPYEVNVPLWSDHAAKERFMALPRGSSVKFSESGRWSFPIGTVLIKTFDVPIKSGKQSQRRKLETRLLVCNQGGWQGYTYVWMEDQTDAYLAEEPTEIDLEIATSKGTRSHTWRFLGRNACAVCHKESTGFVLGLTTRQINKNVRTANGNVNQLRMFETLGLFDQQLPADPDELPRFPEWNNQDAPIGELARAYLDVNCATCHAERTAPSLTLRHDLQYDSPHDPLLAAGREGFFRRLGSRRVPAAIALVPGSPERSEIVRRMHGEGLNRMPLIGSTISDDQALQLLRQWIKQMPH